MSSQPGHRESETAHSSAVEALFTHRVDEVLAGGGQMGALMRSIDWAKSPVGPVEAWPASLRTVLSIVLTSEHPMFVWWGKELVQFYNDGYRECLGSTKHPAAMGQRGRECWVEIWDVISPMIEKVFAGGSTYIKDGLLTLDRNGFLEECYFNYAYSPIKGETGQVAGVFVASTETTGRVLADRRLALAKKLALRTLLDRTVEAVFRSIEEVLAASSDLSFALLYELKDGPATLMSCVGLRPGSAAAPTHLNPDDSASWPLGAVARSGKEERVEDLSSRFGVLTGATWPEPISRAIVLPLQMGAEGETSLILVAGLSPRLKLGSEYLNFIQLLAMQIAASISTARAFEREKQRVEELAELDRAKTDFFSNVSHEFRTPLTLILAPVANALEQETPSLSGQELELVQRNALRLQKLVNTLLDFSRIEAGRTQTKHQPTDLGQLTVDLASAFRSLVERAGLSLTVDCPPLPEAIYVDREMYEKIVLNLLSNAFKFTFTGGITVSLGAANGQVLLTVADTGVGIPEPQLPHLFERFHRVEGARGRSFEGSGIGLALVQELAKLQGGVVAVQSRLGEGSAFSLRLPMGKAHLAPERIEDASSLEPFGRAAASFVDEATHWTQGAFGIHHALSLPTSASTQMSGHILLADDNADMREYVRKLLVDQGFDVEVVGDGEAALQCARARVPDLLLTDVMMPGLDGFGLLRALREDERTRAVPVIFLSARAGEAASIEGMGKGADDYLAKPFSAKELISRVAARLEIARAREAKRVEAVAEREKLHTLFMQAPVGISILEGPQHTFTFANAAYRTLLRGREVVGKPLLEAVPELRGQGIDELINQVIATGQPFIGNELPVRLDRGGKGESEDVFYNLVYSPKRDARGEVDGILVCASDVTEQVQARRRVESLIEELKLAHERKDEFLAMLAHELRNPMAAIGMALLMLERSQGLVDEQKMAKHRATAQRQLGNLVRLVDDLLDVSRITRGQIELRKVEVNLVDLVQNALSSARPTVEQRGHALSLTVGSGALALDADPTRLEQVVVNLLNNAAKYTEPGGILTVRLDREVVAGVPQAVLRVRDTGRGIPTDMLTNVFGLFVQVNPTLDRRMGGLGLGLTLVKSLVELHGGTVMAHSEGTGTGSEFVVRLPLATQAQAVSIAEAPAPATGGRKRRIVVVEDSPDIRETLAEFLEGLGHDVVVAADGVEGAQRILELQPDVALVDVGLPLIDGYEVARRVRASPGGEQIYLVALTGYGGDEAIGLAKSAGFDLHITKPIDINQLLQVVSQSRPEKT